MVSKGEEVCYGEAFWESGLKGSSTSHDGLWHRRLALKRVPNLLGTKYEANDALTPHHMLHDVFQGGSIIAHSDVAPTSHA